MTNEIRMSEKQDLDVLSVRITKSMTRIIDKFLNIDSHVTKSDFVRDAIRDKIKKEAPQLYLEMFEEEK
jgi:Arc/MetJ-type ribon-helix-helix transcriptional regulator